MISLCSSSLPVLLSTLTPINSSGVSLYWHLNVKMQTMKPSMNLIVLYACLPTLRIMSPSCRLPSLVARPVPVISFMKIWLPSRRPYSRRQTHKHTHSSSTCSENLVWFSRLFKHVYEKSVLHVRHSVRQLAWNHLKSQCHKKKQNKRDRGTILDLETKKPNAMHEPFTRSLIQCGEDMCLCWGVAGGWVTLFWNNFKMNCTVIY